ncbi:Adaptive-response sensory-kinase SasA [Paraburkholderia saeva]|uniref:histidine kinase n=2 Tax=Paraburkholderia saeva TaxID=2777537 RepID=A0A9N8X0X4_9BURK|nr:Adaptive-response sensory-kinase SasA [Paraburkholderia saeva]
MTIVMSALVILNLAIVLWWLARADIFRKFHVVPPHTGKSQWTSPAGDNPSHSQPVVVDRIGGTGISRVAHRQAHGVAARLRGLPRSRTNALAETSLPDSNVEDMMELLPLPAVMLGEQGFIARANAQTATLLGYTPNELPGKHFRLLIPEANGIAHDVPAVSSQNPARGNHGASPSREQWARRSDGKDIRVDLSFETLRVNGRNMTLAFIVDRTDRYELNRNRQDLMHLSRVSTMGQLTASLAHELNQPLTAILSNVQAAQRFMARDPVDLDEVREILDDVVKDDHRASEVIRRIRTVVKKGDVDIAPLDLACVIRDAVFLLRSNAILRGVRVTLDIDSALQPVRGDKVQLQQVLLNLLLNALDAMDASPPADREVKVTLKSDGHDRVRIAVRDNGHGLSADRLDRIFKPFFTSKPQGLGLGLSICKSIIDTHHGRLWAENNVDRGATFYVTLPAGTLAEQDTLRYQP